MEMPDFQKAWDIFLSSAQTFLANLRTLFFADPADVSAALGVVVLVVALFTWAWCRRPYRRRIAAADREIAARNERIQLALAQRDDVDAKLTEAAASLSALQRQIEAQAGRAEVTAAAEATGAILHEMKVVSDKLGLTLSAKFPTPA